MKLGKVARLLNMRLRKPFPGTPQHFLAFCPWALSLSKLAAYSAFEIRHPSLKTNKKRVINPLSVILVIVNNNSSNFQVENINDLRNKFILAPLTIHIKDIYDLQIYCPFPKDFWTGMLTRNSNVKFWRLEIVDLGYFANGSAASQLWFHE
jgi:hypothetical protein